MQKNIIKELIQKNSNAGMVASETIKILSDSTYRTEMINNLSMVEKQLTDYIPAQKVAKSLINLK